MFRTDQTEQPQIFAFTVRELVAKDSDIWLYIDLFDRLDLSGFYADYVSQGQPGIDPKLMIRTVFYGLAHGVVSGRKLAEACRNELRFIVLSGEQRPDFRTFHRFVERHHERLEALFVQVVRLAQKMGLVSLGRIAIDGSRLKGNTSRHKAMSYGRMQQAIDKIKEELAALRSQLASENAASTTEAADSLPNEIARRENRLAKIEAAKKALEEEAAKAEEVVDPKSQKSFNDLEAMPMAKVGHEFKYGYNAQAAVDEKSQIIVAAELHDNPQDSGALSTMLDKVEEVCEQKAASVLADSGYQSDSNLEAVEAKGSTPYIAAARGEDAVGPTVIEQVRPTGTTHEYLCPAGKQLPVSVQRSDGRTIIQLPHGFCDGCPFQGDCQLFKKARKAKTITIPSEPQRQARARNLSRLRDSSGRDVYRRRKAIVEPVFGNIKSNKGMRILVKGRRKVGLWWKMAATAHNIEKIVGALAA
jgi:transposase